MKLEYTKTVVDKTRVDKLGINPKNCAKKIYIPFLGMWKSLWGIYREQKSNK